MTNNWDAAEYKRQDFLERDAGVGDTEEGEGGRVGGARMFYAGEVPWHGLGKGVAEAQTSKEAIVLAGLNGWNLGFAPLMVPFDGGYVEVVGRKAIQRGMDGKVLGIASDSYQIVSNEDAFGFMDSLLADGIMKYNTAGSLMGGRKVWLLAELEEGIRVGDDEYKPYLLLVTGHDTVTALRIYPTLVRVVCNNTLRQATSAPAVVTVAHHGNMSRKLEAAKAVLNLTTESHRNMKVYLDKLAVTKLSEAKVTQVEEKLFGSMDEETPSRRKEQIARFRAIMAAEVEREGRTAYANLQAVTGYGDFYMSLHDRDDGEQEMISMLDGSGSKFKEKGIAILSEVAGIKAPSGLVKTLR